MPHTVGPTPLAQRAAAPDLARGAMLLLIVLANVRAFVDVPRQGLRGYPDPAETGALDDAVATAQLLLVDGRAYPMFGLLFGYGVWQLAGRRLAAGTDPGTVVGLLRRRSAVLILVGALHGILLFPGEIIAAYGMFLLLLPAVMVRAPARVLLGWVGLAGVVMLLLLTGTGQFGATEAPGTTDAAVALRENLAQWPTSGVLANGLGVAVTVPIGVLAARFRVLDEPQAHRTLLTGSAAAGLGASVVMGLWFALVGGGVAAPPGAEIAPLMAILHGAGGYLGGIGYAALFGLLGARFARAPGAGSARGSVDKGSAGPLPGRAIRALGQMSMTGYILQSVAFVLLLAPWGPVGLGRDISTAGAAGVACGIWLLSVLLAAALAAAGRRGPFETLVRWWTYAGSSRTSTGSTSTTPPGRASRDRRRRP